MRMRARNPWVRARLRFFGWYVRFIGRGGGTGAAIRSRAAGGAQYRAYVAGPCGARTIASRDRVTRQRRNLLRAYCEMAADRGRARSEAPFRGARIARPAGRIRGLRPSFRTLRITFEESARTRGRPGRGDMAPRRRHPARLASARRLPRLARAAAPVGVQGGVLYVQAPASTRDWVRRRSARCSTPRSAAHPAVTPHRAGRGRRACHQPASAHLDLKPATRSRRS